VQSSFSRKHKKRYPATAKMDSSGERQSIHLGGGKGEVEQEVLNLGGPHCAGSEGGREGDAVQEK